MSMFTLIFAFHLLFLQGDPTMDPLSWKKLHDHALELEKKGHNLEAITKYEQSLKSAEEAGDKNAVARNLVAIGRIRTRMGEYADAMKLSERAKSISEAVHDRSNVISALLVISELHERQSRFEEALEFAQQALSIAEELKDNEPLSAVYLAIGHCYYYQGKFNIALEKYRKSLEFAKLTNNPSRLCRSFLALGVAVLDTGNLEEGIQYLHSALQKAEEADEISFIISILSETGIAYKELGMFEESADFYHRSLRAAEEVGQKETTARILNNLGVLNSIEGKNDEAIQYYHQSLKIAEELKNARGVALLLNNIGNIYRSEGRFDEALSYFERSLKTREEIGDQWGVASALMNIGLIFERQEHYDKAIYVYQRSLKISEQTGNKARVALTLRHLGEAFVSFKNYAAAEESFKKAFDIGSEIQSKIIIGNAVEGLGKVYMGRGKYAEAADYFQQSLKISKEVTQPEMIWRSTYGLAKANEKLERFPQALQFYSETIEEIEKVRLRASSDEGKSSFLADHLSIYEDIIRLLSQLDRKNSGKNYDVLAFEYSERAKARMFLDTLAEFQAGIRKGLTKEELRKEKVILQKISNLQSEVREASTESEQKEKQRKLLDAEGELDHFILQLKLRNPQYAQLIYPEPIKIGEIQKRLDNKSAILEFFLGEKDSFVFSVTSTSMTLISISGKRAIEESVRKFLTGIRSPSVSSLGKHATPDWQQTSLELSQLLFQQLILPAKQNLIGKDRLILILDGILHYVPFETLILEDGRLLLENFGISYAPSATIWAGLHSMPLQPNAKQLIAFADPIPSSSSSNTTLQLEGMENPKRLRYSKEEVEAIASLFDEAEREIYLEEKATESKFQNEEISDYEIIHFATHAVIDEEHPRRSGILLTPQFETNSDGVLQMHEIWNLNLQTKLVVLSACDTGLGKLVSGEGIVSMMRAFFYAGTRGVVVSLWNVDDRSTSDLMKKFYLHMKSGLTPAESLRRSKLEMIQSAKNGTTYAAYEAPYYWAPFILVGPGD